MAQMTRMQQKIYDYIAQMLVQEGYPPLSARSARRWG